MMTWDELGGCDDNEKIETIRGMSHKDISVVMNSETIPRELIGRVIMIEQRTLKAEKKQATMEYKTTQRTMHICPRCGKRVEKLYTTSRGRAVCLDCYDKED